MVPAIFFLKNNPDIFKPKRFAVNFVNYLEIAPGDSLRLKIYSPTNRKEELKPVMVMFHGGGWKSGHIGQFYRHAEQFSTKGFVVALVEYRTESSHGTTPFDALKDARSAVRFVKTKLQPYKVDSSKVIVVGSSAGGHLALSTAMLNIYNHPSDDLSVDTKPEAIITLSGIIDTGPKGFGSSEVKKEYHSFSPFHNISKDLPPLLMFLGDKDRHTSIARAQEFKAKWLESGSSCQLIVGQGKEHGYLNYKKSREDYEAMLQQLLTFLDSIDLSPSN